LYSLVGLNPFPLFDVFFGEISSFVVGGRAIPCTGFTTVLGGIACSFYQPQGVQEKVQTKAQPDAYYLPEVWVLSR
jgi:hypothetical protein